MFLSRHRSGARLSAHRHETDRRRIPALRFCRPRLELLESRIAPAGLLSLPTTGYSGDVLHPVMSFPINVTSLNDGTHTGLASVSLAITFPINVFSLPIANSQATAYVSLGSVPLSDTAGQGGAKDWNLSANATADGNLLINLAARPGDQLNSTNGGSLVTINLPVVLNPSAPTSEAISVVSAVGATHTNMVGTNGTYTNTGLGLPATGNITIKPVTALPPTITTPQNYSTESNTPLNEAAPGVLVGAKDPEGQSIGVHTINGATFTPGTPLTLPSGAALTVNADGSFTYVPVNNFVGVDSFTFTAADSGDVVSDPGTVNITMTPTLSLVPEGPATFSAGSTITEDVVLDNPNPANGAGPLEAFDVALTYDPTVLNTPSDGSQIVLGAHIPSDWTLTPNSLTPGVVGIGAFGTASGSDLVTGPGPIVLASVTFTVIGTPTTSTDIDLAARVDTPNGAASTAINGANGGFILEPALPGQIDTLQLTADGSGYTVPTSVNITGGGGRAASASAQLLNNGTDSAGDPVTGILLTNQGYDYLVPPTVTFFSASPLPPFLVGSGATATATITPPGEFLPGVDTRISILAGPSLTLSPASLPSSDANEAYLQTITATGGTAPYTFAVSFGSLPPGLRLSSGGVLTGTPTHAGTYTFGISAADSSSVAITGEQAYTVTLLPAVSLTPATLFGGEVGLFYAQQFTAANGLGPYKFSTTAGTLPAGLTLDGSSGLLSGTPTTAGNYGFTVTANDLLGGTASQSYNITVSPQLGITETGVLTGDVGIFYSATFQGTGGNGPYTFGLTNVFRGILPPGLTLIGSTGVLSGTPTLAGSFTFVASVSDTLFGNASHTYTLTINPAVAISTTSLPNGNVGSAYSQTITATGGTGAYGFTTTSGTLPTGLSLTTGGILGGTPSAPGTFNFTITATDTAGSSAMVSYTVTIVSGITITPTSLPDSTEGVAGYNQTIHAAGGVGSLGLTLNGTLPPGLSLDPGTGILSGTPTTEGSYNFTITAGDNAGDTGSASYTVVIRDASPTLAVAQAPTLVGANVAVSASGTFADYDDNITSLTASEGTVTPGGIGVTSGTWSWSETPPLSLGTHTVTIIATNADGSTGSTSFTFTVSDVLPIVVVTSAPSSVVENNAASASGTFRDIHSNITSLTASEGTVTPGAPGTGSGTWTWSETTPLSEGSHSVTITATDAAGNIGATTFVFGVTDVKPTIAVTTSPTSVGEGDTASASGTFSDFDDTVTLLTASEGKITPAAPGTSNGSWSWMETAPLADGPHTVTIAALNTDGTTGTASFTFSVTGSSDVRPTVTVTSAPTSVPENAPPTASFAHLILNSSPGSYIGGGKNWDILYGAGSFSANPPNTRLVNGQPAYLEFFTADGFLDFATNQLGTPIAVGTYPNAQRAAFAAAGYAGLDIGFQGAGANTLTGSFTITALSFYTDATQTLRIGHFAASFSENADGGSSKLTGSFEYNDGNAPHGPNAVGASGSFSDFDDNITSLTASEGIVTPAAPGTTTGSWSWSAISPLGDGPHTITITATNANGTTGSTSFTFNVIDVPPTVAVTSAPTILSDTTSASASGTFSDIDDNVTSITASEGMVTLGTPAQSGTWSWSETPLLSDGSHTVTITATNADGTTSSTVFTFTATNLVAPVVTVTNSSTPVAENSAASAAGTFGGFGTTVTSLTASEGIITPGAPGAASGTWTWSEAAPLSDGLHTVTITALNAAGLSGTTSFTFNVTDVHPTVIVTSAPTTVAENAPPTATFAHLLINGSDILYTPANSNLLGATIETGYNVGGQPAYLFFDVAQPGNPDNYSTLTFGTNQLGIPLAVGTYTNAQRAAFATAGHPGLDVSFQHLGANTLTGSFTISALSYYTDTTGTLRIAHFVASFNEIGDGGLASFAGSLEYNDGNAPQGPNTATASGSFGDFDDNITSLTASEGFVTPTAPGAASGTLSWSDTSGLSDGPHTVTITATNADGSTASTSFTFNVTDVNPTVTITSAPTSTLPDTAAATATGTFADFDDNVTSLTTSEGGIKPSGLGSTSGSWTWSEAAPLTDGMHTVTITAINADGSTSSTTFSFAVTNIAPPVVALTSSPGTTPENTAVSASGTFSDLGANVTSLTASEGTVTPGAPGASSGTWTWSESSVLSDGTHAVTITATNAAGSTGSTTFTFNITDVKPTVAVTSAPTSVAENAPPTASFAHLILNSSPGSYIGGGKNWDILYGAGSFSANPPNTRLVNGQPAYLEFYTTDGFLDFATNQLGIPIAVGTYPNAQRAAFAAAGYAGLDIGFRGAGANTLTASFTVTALSFYTDATQTLRIGHFAASFSENADGGSSKLTGSFEYNDSNAPHGPNAVGASGTFSDDDPITSLTASEGIVTPSAPGTSSGTWSWSDTSPLQDGPHTVTITAVNADGSTGSTSFTFNVTDVPPTVIVTKSPATTLPDTTSASASGTFGDFDDNVTSLTASEGTATLGAPAQSGTWSWSEPAPLTDGMHTVTITATNADGSTSSTSFTFSVTSTAAPVVRVGNSPTTVAENGAASASGTFSAIGTTVTSLTASEGIVTPGGPGTATGAWTWSETAPLSDGPHTITITATNAVGSTGSTSFTFNVTDVPPTLTVSSAPTSVAENAPPTATFAHLILNSNPGSYIGQGQHWDITYTPANTNGYFNASAGQNLGGQPSYLSFSFIQLNNNPDNYATLDFGTNALGIPIAVGTYTNAQRAAFAASGHPGLDVTIQHEGANTLTGSFTVSALSYYTDSTGTLRIAHFVASFAENADGGSSIFTGSLEYNDGNAPHGPNTATASGMFSDFDDNITSLTASEGFVTPTAPDTSSGSWSWSDTSPLTEGPHTVTITATNADGSTGSTSFTFNVTDVNPTVTITSAPTSLAENVKASASGTFADFDDNITSLTASEGNITPGGLGSASGTWSWSEASPLGDGTHTVTITATNAAGSTGTTTFTFTVSDVNPTITVTSSPPATVPDSITASASGTFADFDDNVTSLTASEGTVTLGTPAKSGTWTWSEAPALSDGNHTVTITATNADGSTSSTTFTFTAFFSQSATVYVDPTFTSAPGTDPITDPGLGLEVGVNAFVTITAALPHVASGGTLVIFGGEYTEPSVNFNVFGLKVDLATNPSDSPIGSTVQIDNGVTLTANTVFDMTGVATGTGSSVAANLDLVSTEGGVNPMEVTGAAGVNFGGAISGTVAFSGTGGAPVLNATGTLTLAGSGTFVLEVGSGLNETTGELVSSSNDTSVVVAEFTTLNVDGAGSSIFAGGFGGNGTLNKVGTATTLTLTGGGDVFRGTANVEGTLVVNGSLGDSISSINLISPSSVLEGSGHINMAVVVTGTASGAVITGTGGPLNIVNGAGGNGIDVQAGANNVSISNVTVSVSEIGILLEPGNGNKASVTGSSITNNYIGIEPLNGCLTVTGNLINGNNTGVEIPATNYRNPSLQVDPLLTLEGNDLSDNGTSLLNATSMGVTAILNWWGSASIKGAASAIMGVSVDDYTPFALDATSVGPQPTAFDFFNGTSLTALGGDGNVYVTGTVGQDTITATADATDSNVIHVNVNGSTNDYVRGGATNRIIFYGFGDNKSGTSDTISVSDTVNSPWNAQINSEVQLQYREPANFTGLSTSTITTSGYGSDVIFGSGNDTIAAMTSGNNVMVAGLSMGKTGAPTAPLLAGGSGRNIFIAGNVDCALAPMASTGRLDYEALSAIDNLWAMGMGGINDAMNVAALFSVVNSPGAILTGMARTTILPGTGQSWFIGRGAGNPINTPTGFNNDFIAGPTANPNYRQALP